MAGINIVKSVVTPIGVGAVDEALERSDDGAGRTGFKRWSAIARLLAVAGGHAATIMGRGMISDLGETVAISATPLLVKTLAASAVKTKGMSSTFSARRVASSAEARDWAATSPNRTGYRPMQ